MDDEESSGSSRSSRRRFPLHPVRDHRGRGPIRPAAAVSGRRGGDRGRARQDLLILETGGLMLGYPEGERNLAAPACFGELALVGERIPWPRITAIKDSRVWFLRATLFQELCHDIRRWRSSCASCSRVAYTRSRQRARQNGLTGLSDGGQFCGEQRSSDMALHVSPCVASRNHSWLGNGARGTFATGLVLSWNGRSA